MLFSKAVSEAIKSEEADMVEEIEILNADDIKRMIESDWELSLYTCTYNGKQRVTIRCREVE